MKTLENKMKYYKRKFIISRRIKRFPARFIITVKYLLSFFDIQRNKYPDIFKYKDKYKGSTIFIAGAGPSLSTYPDDFFDDKLSMTVHLAFDKFSNPTFASFTESDRALWLLDNNIKFLHTQVITTNPLFPLVRPFNVFKKKLKNPPIVIPYSPVQLKLDNVRKMVDAALKGKKIRYKTNATSLHNAIWSALILGFKTIYLIGCDHKIDNNEKRYFSSTSNNSDKEKDPNDRGVSEDFFNYLLLRQELFLKKIIKECDARGVKIVRIPSYSEYNNSMI